MVKTENEWIVVAKLFTVINVQQYVKNRINNRNKMDGILRDFLF